MDIYNLVRNKRAKRGWIQELLPRAIGSIQLRIAMLEGGNPHVSLELMIRCLSGLDLRKNRLGSFGEESDKNKWDFILSSAFINIKLPFNPRDAGIYSTMN